MSATVVANVSSKIGEISASIDTYVGPVFKNNYFKGALFLFFGLYAGFLAPALPNSVLYFFDTIVGKLLFIFLIAFIATRQVNGSIEVALIVAVMFLLTLTILNNVKMSESFRNLGMEHFELMDQMRNVVNEQFMVLNPPSDGPNATAGRTPPASPNATAGHTPPASPSPSHNTNVKHKADPTAPKALPNAGPTVPEALPLAVPVGKKQTKMDCMQCVTGLSSADQAQLQREFCMHKPLPNRSKSENFESQYANFDL